MNQLGTIVQLVKLDGTNYTAAAGQTTLTSEALDTAGYEGVEIITAIGTIDANGVPEVKLQQCDTSGGTYADLTGSAITYTASDDNKVARHILVRPRERYIKVVTTRAGGANSTILAQVARFFGGRKLPTTEGATVMSREIYGSPAEGTA